MVRQRCSRWNYRRRVMNRSTTADARFSMSKCPVFVDDEAKLYFCNVLKVASTTLSTDLMQFIFHDKRRITDNVHAKIAKNMTRMSPTYYDIQKRSQYFKFLFVRHPFTRLISFFNDKTKGHYMRTLLLDKIVKKQRNVNEVAPDMIPTFAEFVMYLLKTDPLKYNPHFTPYSLMCQPCIVEYDFIGRLESFNEDRRHLFQQLNWTSPGSVDYNSWLHNKQSHTKYTEYFSQLTKEQVRQLYYKYFYDFELFDYSPELFINFAN